MTLLIGEDVHLLMRIFQVGEMSNLNLLATGGFFSCPNSFPQRFWGRGEENPHLVGRENKVEV